VGTRGAGEAARTRRSWEFSATCSLARLLLPSLARSLARSLAFSTIATLLAVIGAKCAIIVPRRVQAEPTRTDGRTGERMDSRWTLDIARATCVWEVAQGSWNPERIHDRGTQDGKSGAVARPNSDLPVDLIAPRSRAMDTRSGKLSGRTATTTLVPANINDDARGEEPRRARVRSRSTSPRLRASYHATPSRTSSPESRNDYFNVSPQGAREHRCRRSCSDRLESSRTNMQT